MVNGEKTLCMGTELKSDKPNRVTYAAIESAEKNEDIYGPFDSVDELMVALNDSMTDSTTSNRA